MSSTPFTHGFRRDPVARAAPEAIVVLLQDRGVSATQLVPILTRWAAAVPTTAFIVLDGIAHDHARMVDRGVRQLQPLVEQQLRACRVHDDQVVLVGFGHGATLGLHMVLHHGLACAGILAIAAQPTRPNLRSPDGNLKVRLIDCVEGDGVAHGTMRDVVAALTAHGLNARGVSLAGSKFSDEAVRLGGAYLVELVATAQRRHRSKIDWESSHAR
jgi:pimeloyl-ACP methyl ester carboxylesterase